MPNELARYYISFTLKRNTDVLVSLSYGNIKLYASFIRPKDWSEGEMDLSLAAFPYQI